ncbi:aspartate kinase [Pullulanibacillus sp. KACC 23026]|uniref:aspartate kinase n=1 Tax=Pullulanibacillus sp. KACC 23026 TaxID=3028315 RepID=UPI0023B1664B|nr:aspartate kinase [Pullulanibacillus sp. KACC 23026]WEG11570.1 aspartate kinase [Pullulanibacillus sp. KACC 23026]
MKIVVQKFGGTSVRNVEDRLQAIRQIKKATQEGYKVVTVVSAMGRMGDPYATDTLLSLIKQDEASKRELDLLMSCGETISSVVFSNLLKQQGLNAEALTGGQAGFRTSANFNSAKITEMRVERIREMFKDDSLNVIVVAGFQGQTETGEITTLGRGGSDTSAAALGAALQAEWIDIFTDVEGVMTADPRIVEGARQLSVLTYQEICNLAYQGAKVIHPRAVEIAMHAKVPLRIRSTYSDDPGTLVTSNRELKEVHDVQERLITGITYVDNVTQIEVTAVEGDFEFQNRVFKAMAEHQISVDFINISPKSVIYTVSESATNLAIQLLNELGFDPAVKRGCAKVSAVGANIAGVPGVTSKIVQSLTDLGIQILQSADSHTTIWVLISNQHLNEAVNALHDVFELDKPDQEKEQLF